MGHRYSLMSLLALLAMLTLLVSPSVVGVLGRKPSSSRYSEREESLKKAAREERRGERGGEGEEEHDEDEHGRHRPHHHDEQQELNLDLGDPQDVLRTDGGAMRMWSQDVGAIRNMAIGVGELELQENGLLLPVYTDVPKIGYVTQGCGYMGAVFPGLRGAIAQPYIRQVKKGDVVAIPEGTIYWWYNNGNEVHRVLCAVDTSVGVHPGRAHQFALVGGQKRHFGSLLHGFSHEALGAAWGVDKETIRSLLESQSEVSIIRTQHTLRFPRSRGEESFKEEEEETTYSTTKSRRHGWDLFDNENNGAARMVMGGRQQAGSHHHDMVPYFREIHYAASRNQPDFFVEKGGIIDMIDFQKFPALLHVGFSVVRVYLEENAMFAPSYTPNAHQLIHVTRGNGRIQVSSGDGRTVFDEEVREGSSIVIPQFFPSVKVAGNEGLEYIDLLSSHRPTISFLAGRNSVYHGIPRQVLASAFNVEQGTLKQLGRDEEVIFPPPSRKSRSRRETRREGERERSEEEEEERRHRRHRDDDDDNENSYWLEQTLASLL